MPSFSWHVAGNALRSLVGSAIAIALALSVIALLGWAYGPVAP